MGTSFTQAIADLTDAVTADGTVEDSGVTLINGLAAQVQAAAGSPAAIEALVATLKANSAKLAAAIAANTPAAPSPPTPAAGG